MGFCIDQISIFEIHGVWSLCIDPKHLNISFAEKIRSIALKNMSIEHQETLINNFENRAIPAELKSLTLFKSDISFISKIKSNDAYLKAIVIQNQEVDVNNLFNLLEGKNIDSLSFFSCIIKGLDQLDGLKLIYLSLKQISFINSSEHLDIQELSALLVLPFIKSIILNNENIIPEIVESIQITRLEDLS